MTELCFWKFSKPCFVTSTGALRYLTISVFAFAREEKNTIEKIKKFNFIKLLSAKVVRNEQSKDK